MSKEFSSKEFENVPETFTSIAIIGGMGQTGQLYTKQIHLGVRDIRMETVVRPKQEMQAHAKLSTISDVYLSIGDALRKSPEAAILAIPNPTEDALMEIEENFVSPLTLILPQNGIDVAQKAQEIISPEINLIRASLFTPIATDSSEGISFNKEKLRIGLAEISSQEPSALTKTKALFQRSGFDVKIFDNYASMEWTKLILNCIGSTAVITGLTPAETFQDRELFTLEAKALHSRLQLLRAMHIPFANIPWSGASNIPLFDTLPMAIKDMRPVRSLLSKQIAKGRDNQPPAATRKIANGESTETYYYHQPFIDLANTNGLISPVDSAVMELISAHEFGILNLLSMSPQERKSLLLDTYEKFSRQ